MREQHKGPRNPCAQVMWANGMLPVTRGAHQSWEVARRETEKALQLSCVYPADCQVQRACANVGEKRASRE